MEKHVTAAPCAVCRRAPLFRLEESRGRKAYFLCPHCDFIRTDPAHRPGEEEERRRYLLHTNSFEDRNYVEYLTGFFKNAVFPFVPPPAKILDFGSGPVPVGSQLLRKAGFSVDSYDPYFHPDRGWENRSYDAILLVEVIEHIFDPLPILRTLRGRLRDGGFLVLRTNLHDGTAGFFDSWWYRQDPTHVSFFSRKTVSCLAGLLSLKLVDIRRECEIILSTSDRSGLLTKK